MYHKAHRGLISDRSGSIHCQAYGVAGLSYTLHREGNLFLIFCEWGLGSGYHLALFLHTHGDRLPVKLPCNPVAAQLLWEKLHCSTPSCSPLLSLPSLCHISLPLFSWKLWAEYFQTLEYFQICRLIEIHVIYVWKWSRWTRHLILCRSNALNFNLCSATCFFTLSKPQQLSVPQPTHLFKYIWWCDPLQLTHILWDCCKSALACD